MHQLSVTEKAIIKQRSKINNKKKIQENIKKKSQRSGIIPFNVSSLANDATKHTKMEQIDKTKKGTYYIMTLSKMRPNISLSHTKFPEGERLGGSICNR